MRLHLKPLAFGLAGIAPLALTCAVLAQDTGGGTKNEARKDQAGGGQSASERRGGDAAHGGGAGAMAAGQHDRVMLISHGLAMAIEGSTLQSLAMQSGGAGGVGATGGAGAAGGGGAAGGADVAGGAGLTGAQGGQSGMQLQQHARSAFESSERLLREAGQGQDQGDRNAAEGQGGQGGDRAGRTPVSQFHTAAQEYASILRLMGDRSGAGADANAGAGAGAGGAAAGGAGATQGRMGGMGGDLQTVATINHAVKEALDARQLRHMVKSMGQSDSPAARSLLRHADEMDRESRQAIQGFASNRGQGGAQRGGAQGDNAQGGGQGATPGASGTQTGNPTDGGTRGPTGDQLRDVREARNNNDTNQGQDRIRNSDAKVVEVSPPIRQDAAGARPGQATQGGQGARSGQTAGQGGAAAVTLGQRAQDILQALDQLDGRDGGDHGAGGAHGASGAAGASGSGGATGSGSNDTPR